MRSVRNGLYPKLAAQGMRQNRRFFLPYLLALAGLTAAFYVMSALCADPGVVTMRGFAYVMVMMQIGMFVAGILSAVLLLYINSFLMKQRKKELGLYNILGMGKGNIALIQCWESLYTSLLGIGGGLLLGVLFHRLATIALVSLLKFSIPSSSLSLPAMGSTAVFFGFLLLLALALNLLRVRVSSPIELLHGGNVGEKEPRTRWLMAVVGAACLGAGYFIAVTTKDPALAMAFYFLAVILVIIGTYCLFTAGSIALLKMLRKNKAFYYQTGHFIGVSGMLYRMKRNAVGLANICILSTMVMVMISGTLALYLGQGEIIAAQYPASLNMTVHYDPAYGQTLNREEAEELIRQFAAEQNVPITSLRAVEFLHFNALANPDTRRLEVGGQGENNDRRAVYLLTAQDYAALTGSPAPALRPGEAAVCGQLPPGFGSQLTIQGISGNSEIGAPKSLTVTDSLPVITHFDTTFDMSETLCLVLSDSAQVQEFWALQSAALDNYAADLVTTLLVELDCTNEEEMALVDAWSDASINENFFDGTGNWEYWRVDSRAEMSVDGYAMAGGFLFLGIILGVIFLMATVLIIYYKQVSEGYEDQGRFEIMRKVGLTQREVKSSIRSQVLLVFFLPIAVAAIHILFDFNLVARMLTLFGVRTIATVALCTVGTLLAFLAVYAVVYLLTARTYYKIVK